MRVKDSKFAEAAAFFKQAHAWNPALPGLDRNWGFAAYRAELYSDAVPPLERQLAAHSDDAFARQILGLSYFVQENYEKTTGVLRPLLRRKPPKKAPKSGNRNPLTAFPLLRITILYYSFAH